MNRKLAIAIAAICGSTTTSIPLPASAQDGAIAVEEIVVSARKRDENLQEVPIAITAFTEETIQKAGIQRPADFISLMPNVTLVDAANVGDTQVSIRGIVSTRDAKATFACVVDGILSNNPPDANLDFAGVYGPCTPTTCDGYQYQERNQVDTSVEVSMTSPQDQAVRSCRRLPHPGSM